MITFIGYMGAPKLTYHYPNTPLKVVNSDFSKVLEKNTPASKNRVNSYRYGFQGQELDNEIKGEGNSINYTFRMHDPRVGRFFAVDPLTSKYPHYTPYSFSGNKVIHAVELEGLEEKIVITQGETKTTLQRSDYTSVQWRGILEMYWNKYAAYESPSEGSYMWQSGYNSYTLYKDNPKHQRYKGEGTLYINQHKDGTVLNYDSTPENSDGTKPVSFSQAWRDGWDAFYLIFIGENGKYPGVNRKRMNDSRQSINNLITMVSLSAGVGSIYNAYKTGSITWSTAVEMAEALIDVDSYTAGDDGETLLEGMVGKENWNYTKAAVNGLGSFKGGVEIGITAKKKKNIVVEDVIGTSIDVYNTGKEGEQVIENIKEE